jgi:hypothetical protein
VATLFKILVMGLLGVLLGLLVTIGMLDPDARGLTAGPWRGAPRDGTVDVDPYALATIARAGLLPLGAAEGLTFLAASDSAGARLSASCDYAVTGPMPTARYWTLSALTPEGAPMANPAERYGFTSGEVLWQDKRPVAITVSDHARAGNWLPVPSETRFVLMLRLYDSSLSAADTTFTAATLPAVIKLGCH